MVFYIAIVILRKSAADKLSDISQVSSPLIGVEDIACPSGPTLVPMGCLALFFRVNLFDLAKYCKAQRLLADANEVLRNLSKCFERKPKGGRFKLHKCRSVGGWLLFGN